MVVLTLTAFKGGPTKKLVVVENPTTIRSVSFEAIHNLNVPMEHADGRIVFPLTHTNPLKMDISGDTDRHVKGVENYTLKIPENIYKR